MLQKQSSVGMIGQDPNFMRGVVDVHEEGSGRANTFKAHQHHRQSSMMTGTEQTNKASNPNFIGYENFTANYESEVHRRSRRERMGAQPETVMQNTQGAVVARNCQSSLREKKSYEPKFFKKSVSSNSSPLINLKFSHVSKMAEKSQIKKDLEGTPSQHIAASANIVPILDVDRISSHSATLNKENQPHQVTQLYKSDSESRIGKGLRRDAVSQPNRINDQLSQASSRQDSSRPKFRNCPCQTNLAQKLKDVADKVDLCMLLLKTICSLKINSGSCYLVQALQHTRRGHELSTKPTKIPRINSARSASQTKADFSAKFTEQLQTLESKVKELDLLINQKVGHAFIKRGQVLKKKPKDQRKVSGFFDTMSPEKLSLTSPQQEVQAPMAPLQHSQMSVTLCSEGKAVSYQHQIGHKTGEARLRREELGTKNQYFRKQA